MKKDKFRTYAAILTIIICVIGIIANLIYMPNQFSKNKDLVLEIRESLKHQTFATKKDEYKIWADPETGVEYIIYNYGGRLVMTARLNYDGSLFVTEK